MAYKHVPRVCSHPASCMPADSATRSCDCTMGASSHGTSAQAHQVLKGWQHEAGRMQCCTYGWCVLANADAIISDQMQWH
jgi:hypothetical protein